MSHRKKSLPQMTLAVILSFLLMPWGNGIARASETQDAQSTRYLAQSKPYNTQIKIPVEINAKIKKTLENRNKILQKIKNLGLDKLSPLSSDFQNAPDANSVEHGKQQNISFQYYPTGPIENKATESASTTTSTISTTTKISSTSEECSLEYIQNMTPQEFISFLKQHDTECIRFFWSYSEKIGEFLNRNDILLAVATEMKSLATSYQGTNVGHLNEMIDYIRIVYYQNYYHSEDIHIDDATKQKILEGFTLYQQNEHILDFNTDASKILQDWVAAVDTMKVAHLYFDTFKNILKISWEEKNRLNDYYQNVVLYYVFYSIYRSAWNSEYQTVIDQETVELIRNFALDVSLLENKTWIINNAIWDLGAMSLISKLHDSAIAVVTEAYDTYETYSEPWLWAVKVFDTWNNCETSRPEEKVCKEDVEEDLKAILFPNTYSFDDGTLVIKTPLENDKIQTLYHAVKEVESQFQRITETITPLPNDPNGTLTMMIYGSRDEYVKYHGWLYGLDTSNGGIYIETWGMFFTYDRTPEESNYSLEDLTRHEYSHYLTGRFLIEGYWGDEQIYENDRMVWFDEGFAEFLAGSTQMENVKPRKTLVELINQDGSNRMSVENLLSSSYGDFRFYQYAGTFFNYLYTDKKEALYEILTYARNADLGQFDEWVYSMKTNTGVNTEYQTYLDQLIANINSLENPQSQVPDLNNLDTNDPLNIQTGFRQSRLGYLGDCSLASIGMNPRFSCRGTLAILIENEDHTSAWEHFNNDLNEIITETKTRNTLNNFEAMNCRFANIHFEPWAEGKYYTASDYYCDGPLDSGNFEFLPFIEQVTTDFKNVRLGINAMCEEKSKGKASCRIDITTSVYDAATEDSYLSEVLDNSLVELQNQVYATRPSYYRDLSCAFNGDMKTIGWENGTKKYALRPTVCEVKDINS